MKPMKGVIKDWWWAEDRVRGVAAFHLDSVPIQAALATPESPIVEGLEMVTSAVESMDKKDGFTVCETANSLYILLGDPVRT